MPPNRWHFTRVPGGRRGHRCSSWAESGLGAGGRAGEGGSARPVLCMEKVCCPLLSVWVCLRVVSSFFFPLTYWGCHKHFGMDWGFELFPYLPTFAENRALAWSQVPSLSLPHTSLFFFKILIYLLTYFGGRVSGSPGLPPTI